MGLSRINGAASGRRTGPYQYLGSFPNDAVDPSLLVIVCYADTLDLQNLMKDSA